MNVKEVQGVKAEARHQTGFFNVTLDHTGAGKIGLTVADAVLLTVPEARHLAECLLDMATKLENDNA